jgi:hypothetical protein
MLRNGLILINIILLFANCVQEVDFGQEAINREELVVSGRFTNLNEPQTLSLLRPGDYTRQAFEPVRGAQVSLSDGTNEYLYVETGGDRPVYVLNHKGEPGKTYTLRIKTPEGTVYQSQPQTMPQPIAIGNIELKGENIEFQRSEGGTFKEPHGTVHIKMTTPADGFLRWDVFRVYIFNEIDKLPYELFPNQKQCFITDYFNTQTVPQLDLSTLQAGTAISQKIGQRRIDYTFEHRQCFSVYQLSTTREAFEYWEKVNRLLALNGTIFDTPPAIVPGNIFVGGDIRQKAALGFFEVCSADIQRKYYVDGDMGDEFRYFENYCQYDWSGRWPPVNHYECHDCLTLGSSSLEKPFYWQ